MHRPAFGFWGLIGYFGFAIAVGAYELYRLRKDDGTTKPDVGAKDPEPSSGE